MATIAQPVNERECILVMPSRRPGAEEITAIRYREADCGFGCGQALHWFTDAPGGGRWSHKYSGSAACPEPVEFVDHECEEFCPCPG